jgi:SAM-dependent methyltransferase
VAIYANRDLAPVEVLILVRHRELLSKRVIELGCGGGRVLGYLPLLGGEVYGLDISSRMVDYCRRAYPQADVRLGDMAAVGDAVEGPFDAILAMSCLIDVYDDDERRGVLAGFRELIAPGGALIFSSHNIASLDAGEAPEPVPATGRRALGLLVKAANQPPARVAREIAAIPRRRRNRRRLGSQQRREDGYAIVNDDALDYSLLHYYIGRDEQARQLTEVGYELLECLDADGTTVAPGERGRAPWLHYVARPQ